MPAFATAQEAKEFLIGRIVEEAQREGVPLSEVERKMLFSYETGWTLPDIAAIKEAFDRDCDQAEYERKIAKLIRNARAYRSARDSSEAQAWSNAIRTLSSEDHYLLAMIGKAIVSAQPRGDLLGLLVTALAIVIVVLGILLFLSGR